MFFITVLPHSGDFHWQLPLCMVSFLVWQLLSPFVYRAFHCQRDEPKVVLLQQGASEMVV